MKPAILLTALALPITACGAHEQNICDDRTHPLYERLCTADTREGAAVVVKGPTPTKEPKQPATKPKPKPKTPVAKPKPKPTGDTGDKPTGDKPGDGDGKGDGKPNNGFGNGGGDGVPGKSPHGDGDR